MFLKYLFAWLCYLFPSFYYYLLGPFVDLYFHRLRIWNWTGWDVHEFEMMIENSKRAKSSQQAAGKKQMMMKKKEAEIHDDQKLWDQIYIICLGELSKLMIDMTCGMLWDSGAGNNSCNGGGGVFLSLWYRFWRFSITKTRKLDRSRAHIHILAFRCLFFSETFFFHHFSSFYSVGCFRAIARCNYLYIIYDEFLLIKETHKCNLQNLYLPISKMNVFPIFLCHVDRSWFHSQRWR